MIEQLSDVGPEPAQSYLDWTERGEASIARYCVGTAGVLFVFVVLAGIGAFPVTVIDPEYKESLLESTAVLLFSFVIPFVGIPLVVRWVHHRPSWSVAMPSFSIDLRGVGVGFVASMVIGVATVLACGLVGAIDLEWVGFDWGDLLPVAAIGAVGIMIQASAEELLFRGYLAQLVRRVSAQPVWFLTIPSVLFSLPHIGNVARLGTGALVLVPYFLAGLSYAWAAWRSGSLFLGIGLHWANNLLGLVVIGTRGDILETVAPVQFDAPGLGLTTLVIGVQAVATIVAVELMVRRRAASR